jgi:hypothetical protein
VLNLHHNAYGKYINIVVAGIKQSPDVAQEIMEDIFHGRNGCFIDDVGTFNQDFKFHPLRWKKYQNDSKIMDSQSTH